MTSTVVGHRFASRLSQVAESATMRMAATAHRLKAAGADLIDLSAGEPDFLTPPHVKDAARRAIDRNFTRYTPAPGVPELRDAVAARFHQDFGVEVKRSEVIVTVGGKQSIFNVVLALVDSGDEVIIPRPYWSTFPEVVRLSGGTPVFVDLSGDNGFAATADDIAAKITPRTRLVILNSPHNPTGSVIPFEELVEICRIAADAGAYVLVDECYQRFVYDGLQPHTAVAVPEALRARVVVAGSLSKTYAMTGWRIGYTIGPAELVSELAIIQGHETSNPNSIAQAAAIEALTGPQDCVAGMCDEYRRRRDYLVPELRNMPRVTCSLPRGAFYVFPDVRALLNGSMHNSMEFAHRLLEEAGVASTPGSGFGAEGFIRLSYAASMRELEEAVRRMKAFVTGLRD